MVGDPIDIALLRGFYPLDGLRRENLIALSKQAELTEILSGRPLFRERTNDKRTYYLVSGEVEFRNGTTVVDRLRGDTPAAKAPILPGNPRRYGAYVASKAMVLTYDTSLLDVLLTWDQTGVYDVDEFSATDAVAPDDWMTMLLRTELFQRIPPANLQTVFMRLQHVTYKAGDVVIKQGAAGDYFYAIREGRCVVTRETPMNAAGLGLAELGPGDTFGEESLISSAPRNATVAMQTDGVLTRLDRSDFNELLQDATTKLVSYPEALERVTNAGARWLDVRLPAEYAAQHLPGAANLPLCFLRPKLNQLDRGAQYVVVCDNGRRSAAAAFILHARGYNMVVLKGGLQAIARPHGQ